MLVPSLAQLLLMRVRVCVLTCARVSVYGRVYLYVCMSVCLSVCLSVCVSVPPCVASSPLRLTIVEN